MHCVKEVYNDPKKHCSLHVQVPFQNDSEFFFFTELYRTSMGTTPLIYIARLRLLFRISDINAANDFFLSEVDQLRLGSINNTTLK